MEAGLETGGSEGTLTRGPVSCQGPGRVQISETFPVSSDFTRKIRKNFDFGPITEFLTGKVTNFSRKRAKNVKICRFFWKNWTFFSPGPAFESTTPWPPRLSTQL